MRSHCAHLKTHIWSRTSCSLQGTFLLVALAVGVSEQAGEGSSHCMSPGHLPKGPWSWCMDCRPQPEAVTVTMEQNSVAPGGTQSLEAQNTSTSARMCPVHAAWLVYTTEGSGLQLSPITGQAGPLSLSTWWLGP